MRLKDNKLIALALTCCNPLSDFVWRGSLGVKGFREGSDSADYKEQMCSSLSSLKKPQGATAEIQALHIGENALPAKWGTFGKLAAIISQLGESACQR